MFKRFRINILLLLFSVATCIILLIGSLVAVKAETAPMAALNAANPLETWSLGITVEGPPTYNDIVGRLVSDVAVFRSARFTEGTTIFAAPATARTVQSANFYLLNRTGTYAGTATLSLVIYNYSGTIQHSVSAAGIDLQTTPMGVWTPVTLSGIPNDLIISPGEFLAFRFTLSGSVGGNLDVRPLFEVSVQ
jgi:hypothetical protein